MPAEAKGVGEPEPIGKPILIRRRVRPHHYGLFHARDGAEVATPMQEASLSVRPPSNLRYAPAGQAAPNVSRDGKEKKVSLSSIEKGQRLHDTPVLNQNLGHQISNTVIPILSIFILDILRYLL